MGRGVGSSFPSVPLQGPDSTANISVDVLFQNPRLTSLKKTPEAHPADSKMPLMGSVPEDGITVALDDSAMVAEDISGTPPRSIRSPVLPPAGD